MTIINLRERYGRQYRIVNEESFAAQYGPRTRTEDPHFQIIPGRLGHVYAWDSERLAASSNSAGTTAKKLKALSYGQIWQDGTDGVTVLFPADRLDEVADLLKLRRRRRISDQERARLAELSRQHGFRAGQLSPRSISESDSGPPVCVGGALPDPEATKAA